MDKTTEQALYQQWLKRVDQIVISKAGLSLLDLPDMDYFGMWKRGVTPKQAANRAIRNAGE